MYLKHVYKLFILLLFAVLFQSRSNGPASVANLQVTGAPGSTGNMGTCANSGCHVVGGPNASIDLSFTTMGLDPVDQYEPGTEYFVELAITATETFSGTGFQMVALDQNDESIGSWTSLPAAAQQVELGGRFYVEHQELTTLGNGTWELNWTAPATGSGPVTFYAAGLTHNNSGNAAGDGVATTTFTVTENDPSSINNANQDLTKMLISPNQVIDQANVSVFSKRSGDFDLNIFNTTGQLVYSENVNLQVGENQQSVNLGQLQQGIYFLQISGGDEMITKRLLKL